MENSLLFIFHKIWPKILYYSTWTLVQFISNSKKIRKKFNFDWNQLKVCTQHKSMYVYPEKL